MFSKEIESSVQPYLEALKKQNDTVKVLGMHQPVPLKSLYVRANILEKITSRSGLNIEELEKFFDRDKRTFGNQVQTIDGELIVNKLKQFIVLGKPGAGKTTYLKYLTLMMLDPASQIKERKLPIFVTLREFADKKVPLIDFIAAQFSVCQLEAPDLLVKQELQNGTCLVLFDGLDEVSEQANQSGIIQQIIDFTKQYDKNQFIISCRVAAYNYWFEQFTDVEMADFNLEQIKIFIENWFATETEIAEECLKELQESPQLKDIASVPLLLTLLCIAYNRNNKFPPNRANLYEEAIDALLRDWDATRRIKRDEIYQQLSMTKKKSLLARIAAGTFMENQYFIPERILAQQIQKFIEHLSGFELEDLKPDSRVILKAIEAQHGIFVERAKGVYSFAHLTFQEYFTAKYIVDNAREGTLERLVEKHLYDDKWLEVFRLVTSMLDNADELILRMRLKNDEILLLPEAKTLVELSEKAILPIESGDSAASRRCYCICFVLARILARARALDRAGTRALSLALDHNLGLTLASARTLDRILDRRRALKREHGLYLDYLISYADSNIFETEIALKIRDYLKGNIWILQCVQADAFISKWVQEYVLSTMLTIPKE